MSYWPAVIVSTPAHSSVAGPLTYRSEFPLLPGALVRVPLGRRETLGVVWDVANAPPDGLAPEQARPVTGALEGLAPLAHSWRDLVAFAAGYYQRSLGEVALAALPPQLRDMDATQLARRLKRATRGEGVAGNATATTFEPTVEQARAVDAFNAGAGPFLLHGATGSGKTEVYLRCVQDALEREPRAQALIMVPEINLTPQFEERLRARFDGRYGAGALVSLHSGMTPAQRLRSWLAAHAGAARIVLGTRMAVFASLPALRLIVVDEEHDPSYKQQEGARYSARDLAVYRARLDSAKVLLGSATPSLESWHQSRPGQGRYTRLEMPSRVGAQASNGGLPQVRMVDMNLQPKGTLFAPALLQAITSRLARGEQSVVFLNRRGYAPVLHCGHCDWKSECPNCSAYRVFHKIDRSLRCHHCGLAQAVPRACPSCGNPDISPWGRGTERLEEQLSQLLSETRRPDGGAARVARIDADTTRAQGALQAQLAQVHAGEVDVLVGTQMIAKGHDFRRVTLVAAVQPDGALFSSDFRAPERLFSLLMQAAGRAGRDADRGTTSEMWIQTHHPQHPLYEALRTHDYAAFAHQQLEERRASGMPPFSHQALVRSEARTQEAAQAFLLAAREAAQALPDFARVSLYQAVPMNVQRVANVERAQMLVECASRAALQRFLRDWQPVLRGLRTRGLIRWAVDVDPLAI